MACSLDNNLAKILPFIFLCGVNSMILSMIKVADIHVSVTDINALIFTNVLLPIHRGQHSRLTK